MPARPPLRSWVDGFHAVVERIPVPPWVTYVVLVLVCVGLSIGLRLLDHTPISPVTVGFAALTFVPLAVNQYANRAAKRALHDFRPALGELESEYDDLEHRLTTTPFWAGIVAVAIAGAIVGLAQLTANGGWGVNASTSALTNVLTILFQLILNASFVAFVIHVFGQVGTIVRIHRESTGIRLWYTPPHDAFARVTSLTALSIIVPFSIIELAAAVFQQSSVIELVLYGFALVIAILLFVLPLRGMRRRLSRERERRLNEVDRSAEIAAVRLQEAIDRDDFSSVGEIESALNALNLERERLKRVSTSPWSANTLRAFVTTLGVPVLLWFVTTVLGRVLFA